jgi:hypothetical protein
LPILSTAVTIRSVRVIRALAVIAALFVLSACGSAHRTRSDYSVKRVVSAFNAHGVALHMGRGACGSGFVCLDNGDGVQVDVFVGPKSGQLVSVMSSSEHRTNKANLTVTWEQRYRSQVRKALSSLS